MSEEIKRKITDIEAQMAEPTFWDDKDKAQMVLQEYNDLKEKLAGVGKYDKLNAVVTIFAGAGGDDAEDFAKMLFEMYQKYADKQGFGLSILHDNQNDQGGFRNITFKIEGPKTYGILKNESGVHRLVRLSPFNAKKLRHTSFAMVEVIPEFTKPKTIDISPDDLKIEFTRSGGPGGQNVNKRETAVRIVHLPTGLSVSASNERSQEANKEKALAILEGKIYKKQEADRKKVEQGMQISTTVSNEWGSQIRSYVIHPYKMVKDHRTEVETSDVEGVLGGDLSLFLEAEKDLAE